MHLAHGWSQKKHWTRHGLKLHHTKAGSHLFLEQARHHPSARGNHPTIKEMEKLKIQYVSRMKQVPALISRNFVVSHILENEIGKRSKPRLFTYKVLVWVQEVFSSQVLKKMEMMEERKCLCET